MLVIATPVFLWSSILLDRNLSCLSYHTWSCGSHTHPQGVVSSTLRCFTHDCYVLLLVYAPCLCAIPLKQQQDAALGECLTSAAKHACEDQSCCILHSGLVCASLRAAQTYSTSTLDVLCQAWLCKSVTDYTVGSTCVLCSCCKAPC